MSILSGIKTYILTYGSLVSGAPVWVDFLGADPTGYSIVPLPGTKIVESYIDGSSVRVFPFAFQSMESTADELERLETQAFFEAFADWLEQQTAAGTFPSIGNGKTVTEITALGWAYLYQEGESGTGVYQIQCSLTYNQSV